MRYLGIDYGRKRVGLALGEKGLTFPLAVYNQDKEVFFKIGNLCRQESIDKIILGLSSDLEEEIGQFGKQLRKIIGLPVTFQDEALTTREAVAKMLLSSTKKRDRREKIDAVAAAQILVAYFSNRKKV